MATKLNLLGEFELISPGDQSVKITSKNSQIILAMLAVSKDMCLPRDKFLGMIWGSRSEQQARNSLRQTLSSLRKIFSSHELDFFHVDYTRVCLYKQNIDVDVLKIPDLNPGLSTSELVSVLKMYRGEFLANLHVKDAAIEQWLDTQRHYFNKRKKELMEELINVYYEKANYKNVVTFGNEFLALDPLNESIHRLIMHAFLGKGDRVNALKQYQRCTRALDSELSIAPSKKTTLLYKSVLDSTDDNQLLNLKHNQETQISKVSEKPSIVILPFKSINPNQQHDSLSAGLTEDITTHLSRFRDLLVINGSSVSTYKDNETDLENITENRKAEYMLEGSVQKFSGKIRVSTKLVEATSGIHLWTEIYDRNIDQFSNLQDEVSEMIVATLACVYGGRLRKACKQLTGKDQAISSRAFDYFSKAIDCANTYTKRENIRARENFKKAIEIDPGYAKAYSGIACTYLLDAVEAWKNDYDACMKKCLHFATKAIECDDSESWSYWQLAVYFIYTMEHDLALLEFEKAIQLNPNDADVLADAGYYFSYCGNSKKGLEYAQKAMRLNPHFPEYYLLQMGQIFFDAHQYENAIKMYRKSHRTHTTLANLYLAASHAALGHSHESKNAIKQALLLDKNATLKKWTDNRLSPYKYPKDLNHFRQHLKSAGLH